MAWRGETSRGLQKQTLQGVQRYYATRCSNMYGVEAHPQPCAKQNPNLAKMVDGAT